MRNKKKMRVKGLENDFLSGLKVFYFPFRSPTQQFLCIAHRRNQKLSSNRHTEEILNYSIYNFIVLFWFQPFFRPNRTFSINSIFFCFLTRNCFLISVFKVTSTKAAKNSECSKFSDYSTNNETETRNAR